MNEDEKHTSRPPRIHMLGAGAMGSLFGGLLAEQGGRVTLIDPWREHLAAVAKDGLTLEENGSLRTIKNLRVCPAASEAGEADCVLVFVKARDTAAAIAAALPCLRPDTLALTLQNGLGNAEALAASVRSAAKAVGRADMDGFTPALGVTACGATMLGPGRVRFAGRGETVLGWAMRAGGNGGNPPDPSGIPAGAAHMDALCALLRQAGLAVRHSGNILGDVWGKLLVNAGINAVTALCGINNGIMAENADAQALLRAAVAEGAAVAKALGIPLAPPDPAAHALAVARGTAENASSMLQDIRAGRLTEIQAINGAIAERAAALGLAAPVNETLARLVRIRETLPFSV